MTEQDGGQAPGEPGGTQERISRPVTWRALAISIAVAVVLSAAATLLLRDFFCPVGAGSVAGTRAAGNCCQPRGTK